MDSYDKLWMHLYRHSYLGGILHSTEHEHQQYHDQGNIGGYRDLHVRRQLAMGDFIDRRTYDIQNGERVKHFSGAD